MKPFNVYRNQGFPRLSITNRTIDWLPTVNGFIGDSSPTKSLISYYHNVSPRAYAEILRNGHSIFICTLLTNVS
jgi:hypothetical protein